MKKVIIYLLLVVGLESFLSATPSFIFKAGKRSEVMNTGVSAKKNDSKDSIDNETSPLNIMALRYF